MEEKRTLSSWRASSNWFVSPSMECGFLDVRVFHPSLKFVPRDGAGCSETEHALEHRAEVCCTLAALATAREVAGNSVADGGYRHPLAARALACKRAAKHRRGGDREVVSFAEVERETLASMSASSSPSGGRGGSRLFGNGCQYQV